jgi:hypothetical protein
VRKVKLVNSVNKGYPELSVSEGLRVNAANREYLEPLVNVVFKVNMANRDCQVFAVNMVLVVNLVRSVFVVWKALQVSYHQLRFGQIVFIMRAT